MKKIALIGAPGVGKTTLANGLMYHLKIKGKHVELVPELIKYKVYKGLDFTEPGFDVNNTQEQKEFEDTFNSEVAKSQIDYLICEGPLCNGYFYAKFYQKENEIEKLQSYALENINKYDVIIFVQNTVNNEYVSFGRKESKEQSLQFEIMIKDLFQKMGFENQFHYVNKDTDIEEVILLCL